MKSETHRKLCICLGYLEMLAIIVVSCSVIGAGIWFEIFPGMRHECHDCVENIIAAIAVGLAFHVFQILLLNGLHKLRPALIMSYLIWTGIVFLAYLLWIGIDIYFVVIILYMIVIGSYYQKLKEEQQSKKIPVFTVENLAKEIGNAEKEPKNPNDFIIKY